MDKPTPGPWEVLDNHNAIEVVTREGFPVAQLWKRGNRERHMEDARLIAAAPDLLKALNAIRTANGGTNFDGWHSGFDDAISQARAAIAKAEGQS